MPRSTRRGLNARIMLVNISRFTTHVLSMIPRNFCQKTNCREWGLTTTVNVIQICVLSARDQPHFWTYCQYDRLHLPTDWLESGSAIDFPVFKYLVQRATQVLRCKRSSAQDSAPPHRRVFAFKLCCCRVFVSVHCVALSTKWARAGGFGKNRKSMYYTCTCTFFGVTRTCIFVPYLRKNAANDLSLVQEKQEKPSPRPRSLGRQRMCHV